MGKKGPIAGNIYSKMKKQGVWNPVDQATKSKLAGSPFKTHEAGKPHVSNKPTYGYNESGEFIQTGGTPRPSWSKPLSNYKANERKQLIESGTISPNTYEQPTGGGSDAYLLGGNTQMKNFVESSNQRSGSPFKHIDETAEILSEESNTNPYAQTTIKNPLVVETTEKEEETSDAQESIDAQKETNEYLGDAKKQEVSVVNPASELTPSTVVNAGLGDMNQQVQNANTLTAGNLGEIVARAGVGVQPSATANVPISPKAQRAANKIARLESRPQTERRDLRIQKQQLKAAGVDRKTIRTAKTVTKAMQAEESGNTKKAQKLKKRARRQIRRSKK